MNFGLSFSDYIITEFVLKKQIVLVHYTFYICSVEICMWYLVPVYHTLDYGYISKHNLTCPGNMGINLSYSVHYKSGI